MSDNIHQPERLVLVLNPNSAHAERANKAVINPLMASEWGSKLVVLETEDPDTAGVDNVSAITDFLQEGDLFGLGGGDGVDNIGYQVVEKAHEDGKISREDLTIVSFPFGDGNDLSLSISKGVNIARRKRFFGTLNEGSRKWVDAMEMTIETDEAKKKLIVHSYVGRGLTGDIANNVNSPLLRKVRKMPGVRRIPGKLLDTPPVVKALIGREPFKYSNEDGEIEQAHEQVCAVMPRMAGGTIRMGVDPFEQRMIQISFGQDHLMRNVAMALAKSRTKKGMEGKEISRLKFRVHDQTYMHYDGEPMLLEPGADVTIAHRPKFVQVLTRAS